MLCRIQRMPRSLHIKGVYLACVVLLTFLSSLCDVRYDLRMKAMFGSSLPLVVCGCNLRYLCFCFVFLRLVAYVANFFGLFICDCPFGIL
jgi:hypothetical protein